MSESHTLQDAHLPLIAANSVEACLAKIFDLPVINIIYKTMSVPVTRYRACFALGESLPRARPRI